MTLSLWFRYTLAAKSAKEWNLFVGNARDPNALAEHTAAMLQKRVVQARAAGWRGAPGRHVLNVPVVSVHRQVEKGPTTVPPGVLSGTQNKSKYVKESVRWLD